MEIIENFIELDDIIKQTNGKYPLFIKITNGDNTGYDPEHPDLYRFDYASPVLSQIDGHESEAFSTDKNNLGVNIFATTVMRSRNFDIKKWSCLKGDGQSKEKLIIGLPDGTEVSENAVTFDWTLFKLFEMLGISCNKINCHVAIYGEFGGNLPVKFAKAIPSQIKGDLVFVSRDHKSSISPSVSYVGGQVHAIGIQFSNWSPSKLGDKGKMVTFGNCKGMPDLSSCQINGDILISSCMTSQNMLPKDVGGSMTIIDCPLGKVKSLPNVSGTLTIAGDQTFNIDELERKPKIGKNIQISKALFIAGTISEEKIKEKFDVSGEIEQVDDDEVRQRVSKSMRGFIIGNNEETLGKWGSIGAEIVDQSFGKVGHAIMSGLYKKFTGKNLPPTQK